MTTWVLLRGLAREAGHWGGFVERLGSALGPGEVLVPLDLPGAGRARGQASPATVPSITAACRRALALQGAQPPYRLVAMSLGAMVAIQWTHDAPGEVAGCALINTSLRGLSPFWERLRPRNYGRLLGLLLPGLPVLARERMVLAMTSSRPEDHSDVPGEWARIARERPVSRTTVIRQLVAAARFSASGPPPASTLLLASKGDGLVAPRSSRRMAERWGAPLQMHADAGHDLPLDDPDWLVRELVAWARAG
jgi:alpha-beta hydrolase superfamily lysophospholipase